MRQLFEFVKVASGEPFPFETGTFYSHFDDTPKEFWMSRIDKGSVQHKDIYILRPAESPDAGREEFIEKVIKKAIEVGGIHYRHDEFADFMRSHWPAAGAAEPGIEKNILLKLVEAGEMLLKADSINQNSVKDIQLAVKSLVALTAPSAPSPVGVTREDADRWARRVYPLEYLIQREQHKAALAMFDYLQGKAITPADPGSQVEAVDGVKLLEWVVKSSWKYGYSSDKWWNRIGDYIGHADLIALYQQSLNEKK